MRRAEGSRAGTLILGGEIEFEHRADYTGENETAGSTPAVNLKSVNNVCSLSYNIDH